MAGAGLDADVVSRLNLDLKAAAGKLVAEAPYAPRMAFRYEVHAVTRAGQDRVHEYASDSALGPGDVILLRGRYWLLESVDASAGAVPARVVGKPARYRLVLRHPDGREEAGAFRRYRPDGPRLGHAFTTVEEGQPASWQVADERLASDEEGEPYLELVAERDFGEFDALPDHGDPQLIIGPRGPHLARQRQGSRPRSRAGQKRPAVDVRHDHLHSLCSGWHPQTL